MKIRKNYILYVSQRGDAFYGGRKFESRIGEPSLGTIIDCTLSELKANVKRLRENGYSVIQQKW